MPVLTNLFLRFEHMNQYRLLLGLTSIMLVRSRIYQISASEVGRPRPYVMADLFAMFGPGSNISGWRHMLGYLKELWGL